MDGGNPMNKPPEDFEEHLLADIRTLVEEDLRKLQNVPRGRERSLREAEILMRMATRVVPKAVSRGDFDGAAALFGVQRDAALTDPLRWGGNNERMPGEMTKMLAGATADYLHKNFKITRQSSFKKVSNWTSGTGSPLTAKVVANWAQGGREYAKEGRGVGYDHLAKSIPDYVARRATAQTPTAIGQALCDNLQRFIQRADNVREALEE
ncbi:hypothetical protein [Ruegeria sp.]|uniref:hypothetical protein n=1 Tax=Ruegeria sp. TaxID=1879320 RepID=UPI003B001878